MAKGVSRCEDARRVVDVGAAGLSVRNHGVNNLDGGDFDFTWPRCRRPSRLRQRGRPYASIASRPASVAHASYAAGIQPTVFSRSSDTASAPRRTRSAGTESMDRPCRRRHPRYPPAVGAASVGETRAYRGTTCSRRHSRHLWPAHDSRLGHHPVWP